MTAIPILFHAKAQRRKDAKSEK